MKYYHISFHVQGKGRSAQGETFAQRTTALNPLTLKKDVAAQVSEERDVPLKEVEVSIVSISSIEKDIFTLASGLTIKPKPLRLRIRNVSRDILMWIMFIYHSIGLGLDQTSAFHGTWTVVFAMIILYKGIKSKDD